MQKLAHAPAAAPQHRTAVGEKGSFASASCGCGWRGPARRSRDKARSDAAAHETSAAQDTTEGPGSL